MHANQKLQHLEGKITIPCHAYPAQLEESGAPEHTPQPNEIPIHVYQFADAVVGGKPLLVIHTPLDPVCPVNGNGTVLAYS
jgi:hypothetical protein